MNISYPADRSSAAIIEAIDNANSNVVFIGDPQVTVEPSRRMMERMTQVLRESGAGMVYSDGVGHPRIDYQSGSLRDNFDFGPVIAVPMELACEALPERQTKWGGLYDLRLRISEKHPVVRIPEPLYAASTLDSRTTGEKQFDYADPTNRDYQVEMEGIATDHLKRIGAYLDPKFESVPRLSDKFLIKASIVIPVKNRERTIAEAVRSALDQKTDFDYNVIVVDNHSTDKTTEILRGMEHSRLVHIVPESSELGIGGCWNEAIYSPQCGKYVVQLDSDDLYVNDSVLARIIAELEGGPYAMVVGSYTTVDFSLTQIPPGLIDHREWTRDNGRNNALRINGLGAPRAFDTAVLRRIGFPDVSYGEDYAVALRISRHFEIGRIYDSLYLCRRWEGNTDSALALDMANRFDAYKDWVRTMEIMARRNLGR